MVHECLRCAIFALLAAVVVSVAGQSSEERALNTTGLWSKYNLIVKPTAVNGVAVTTLAGDLDARYKSSSKTKYNHRTDKPDFDRPNLSNHNLGAEPASEEQEQYSQEVVDDEEAEDEGDDDAEEEEEEEETLTSDELDEAHRSTTQRSQAIHHKAPVKVAVIEVSTAKSAERKNHKKKKGSLVKPIGSTAATIHHHHHHDDDDSTSTADQKGHKGKGVKKLKLKGLKKLRKYMLPLLLAYKLKFFTLVPLLLGGLVLIVASTGFAGFFFALFAVGVGLKKD